MFPSEGILPSIRKIYTMYEKLWNVDVSKYEIGSSRLILPVAQESLLSDLCRGVADMFSKEPIVLDIDSDCLILGDLHGHILDLFRVLKKFGTPEDKTYLVLGDLVDRGEFSLETVTLVFILKALFPKNVYVIRGNHEFPAMFQYNGFAKQIEETYGNHTVTYAFSQAFSVMPLAAKICNKIFCVHGGISPLLQDLTQLTKIERPILDYSGSDERDQIIADLVWSDPSTTQREFTVNPRGIGKEYGYHSIAKFLMNNKLRHLR